MRTRMSIYRYLRKWMEQGRAEEIPRAKQKLLEAKLKEAQNIPDIDISKADGGYRCVSVSLTDADARLMKNKNGFAVAYNPLQTALGATHLIRDFEMTNQVTDHGLLSPTMSRMREEEPDKILETVADKGYENAEDMLQCLENGIIPHVIMEDGKDR